VKEDGSGGGGGGPDQIEGVEVEVEVEEESNRRRKEGFFFDVEKGGEKLRSSKTILPWPARRGEAVFGRK